MHSFVQLCVNIACDIGFSVVFLNNWLLDCILCALKLCVTQHAVQNTSQLVPIANHCEAGSTVSHLDVRREDSF